MQHAKPGAALKAQGFAAAVVAFAQFSEKAARRSTRPTEAAPSNAAMNASSLSFASIDRPYTRMAARSRQVSVDGLAVRAVGRLIARMPGPAVSFRQLHPVWNLIILTGAEGSALPSAFSRTYSRFSS